MFSPEGTLISASAAPHCGEREKSYHHQDCVQQQQQKVLKINIVFAQTALLDQNSRSINHKCHLAVFCTSSPANRNSQNYVLLNNILQVKLLAKFPLPVVQNKCFEKACSFSGAVSNANTGLTIVLTPGGCRTTRYSCVLGMVTVMRPQGAG